MKSPAHRLVVDNVGGSRERRRSRGALPAVVLYLFQLLVIAPLHQREIQQEQRIAFAPRAVAMASAASAIPAAPCNNPDHRHRPLPPHNETSCTVCSAAGHALPAVAQTLPVQARPSMRVEPPPVTRCSSSSRSDSSPRAPPTPAV